MDLNEIKNKMKGGAITKVIRMTKNVNGTKKDTETVMLEFQGELIPKRVMLGLMSYMVREYIPKPMRCFKCQKFGHVAARCKEEQSRCARCGGKHEYGKCGKGVQPKCCNCGGAHSAAYWGCEVMKREVEIQKMRTEKKLSYAEAAKQMKGQTLGQNVQAWGPLGGTREVPEKSREVEKKKLVVFIAGVINTTAGVESKTEKIRLVVKAAVHHLGMIGLNWEEVNEELKATSTQETFD